VDVVVQYFEGCPHAQLAIDRLREALRSAGQSQDIGVRRIDSPEEAAVAGFHGSPTILLDGADPFEGESPAVGFACRVYQTDEGREGAPSLAQLVQLLERGSRAS